MIHNLYNVQCINIRCKFSLIPPLLDSFPIVWCCVTSGDTWVRAELKWIPERLHIIHPRQSGRRHGVTSVLSWQWLLSICYPTFLSTCIASVSIYHPISYRYFATTSPASLAMHAPRDSIYAISLPAILRAEQGQNVHRRAVNLHKNEIWWRIRYSFIFCIHDLSSS